MKGFKKSIFGGLLLVSATLVTGCFGNKNKGEKGNIQFWSPFGTTYSTYMNEILDGINTQHGIKVDHTPISGYPNILSEVKNLIGAREFPNVVVGYPDHFVQYAAPGIVVPLDDYIATYNSEHGTDIMNENTTKNEGGYYEKYMEENKEIMYDKQGKALTTGLPFNKSTELMGYNGVFVDFCKDWCEKNPTVKVDGVPASQWNLDHDHIPTTWQQWAVTGKYYRHIMEELCEKKSSGATQIGKKVYGVQDYEGYASQFEVKYSNETAPAGKTMLLDFNDVKASDARVMGWDSTDNMFITLIRQWGADYTEIKASEKLNAPKQRKGTVKFLSSQNIEKVVDCVEYFYNLNIDGIFGTSSTFGSNFCSDAFKANKVMFMICSSGGLSYNTAEWRNRFRVKAMPYFKEGGVVRKHVVSQGANIGLLDQKKTGDMKKAFEFMVHITSAENQAKWCLATGYYPGSTSAVKTTIYQNFLHEVEIAEQAGDKKQAFLNGDGSPAATRAAYREGSVVNEDYYMPSGKHYNDDGVAWDKFVDAPFVGSAEIRTVVGDVFPTVLGLRDQANDNAPYTGQALANQIKSVLASIKTNDTITSKMGGQRPTIEFEA